MFGSSEFLSRVHGVVILQKAELAQVKAEKDVEVDALTKEIEKLAKAQVTMERNRLQTEQTVEETKEALSSAHDIADVHSFSSAAYTSHIDLP